MLALSVALQAAGHDVLLCGPPEHAEWVGSYQCPYHPVGRDLKSLVEQSPDAHSFRAALGFLRFLRIQAREQFNALLPIVKKFDMVLSCSLMFHTRAIAEGFGLPHRFLAFCPQIIPSSYHPPIFIRNMNLPRWMNRFWWRAMFWGDAMNFSMVVNRMRRRLGLKPVFVGWKHVLGKRIITAFDEELAPVPPDVKQKCLNVGYLNLDQGRSLEKKIEAFLGAGPAPMYAGFGSMPQTDPVEVTRILVAAAGKVKQRIVISSGWGNLGGGVEGEDVLVIGDAPHESLLPRCSLAIHHGGAGTTAYAARAGIPQIIVPHITDQYYWGKRIFSLGLGPRPVPRSRLSIMRLIRAMTDCLENEGMKLRAGKLGDALSGRDNAARAVRIIEEEYEKER